MYNKIIIDLLDIFNQKEHTYYEVLSIVKSYFNTISDLLHVGRLFVTINSKDNLYSSSLNTTKYSIVNRNKFNEENVIKECNPIKGEGFFELEMYPEEKFTEEEKQCLKRLTYIIFTYLSKLKTAEIINESPFLDQLTGTKNTQGIARHVGFLISTNQIEDYASIFINIKDCGSINKICGGDYNGDIIIKRYAEKIESFLDIERGEIIGRHGGDNFSIIVRKENLEKLLELLDSIKIQETIKGNQVSIDVEAMIGVYEAKKGDQTDQLMGNSSIAMRIAKNNKKNKIVRYDNNLRERIETSKRIISNFPIAKAEERICAFFQPKVDSSNNTLVGAEALARWYTPEGTLLPPGIFVPSLERENLVAELDFAILEDVCRKLRNYIEKGLDPVPISVNFSRYNFLKSENKTAFVRRIIETIRRYNIDPKYIEVEFTESGKFEDYEILNELIKRIHDFGMTAAIDDYGTGYSSLQLLEKVPFDTIKMDKTFADSIGTSTGNTIFKHTTEMVRDLQKSIVCEGIELPEQIEFLNDIGCNIIQGYYYDKPLPNDEFELRLVNRIYNK